MVVLHGKSVYPGIGIGRLAFYKKEESQVPRYVVENRRAELERFELAREKASLQLKELYLEAKERMGAENAAIFEMHEVMLRDEEYCGSIRKRISDHGENAEYAVHVVGDQFNRQFLSMEETYIRERAADVADVTMRLLRILSGRGQEKWGLREPSIVAAQELSPSETVQLPKDMLLGLLLRRGSMNSHAAILARSMGIPALINIGEQLSDEYDGFWAAVDAGEGTVCLDPDKEILDSLRRKKEREEQRRVMLTSLKGKENVTLDGRRIQVYANAGSLEDVKRAKENDAGGIGLLRSEILFLEGDKAPDEETQYRFYTRILEEMGEKEVIIRTMDIGADKQVPYLKLETEENPALGCRAIRLGLKQPEIFLTQLRALYRAGNHGRLAVMYPMITSPEEIGRIRLLEQQAREELRRRGERIPDRIPTGIMIETPAAALLSRELASLVDFFSVGTNDLTQYTLAVDRQNEALEEFCDPRHRAVLKLIGMAAGSAREAGIRIGVCGELAADPELTEVFLRMGIEELSVAPAMVLPLRKRIRELKLCGTRQEGTESAR